LKRFKDFLILEKRYDKYEIYYHGTTIAKGEKILKKGLEAHYYEPQWFTIIEEPNHAWYHAKKRNSGKTPCVIEIKLPKEVAREFVYKEGGLKKAIPVKYLRMLSNKEIKDAIQ
jgi:hypothetical protein